MKLIELNKKETASVSGGDLGSFLIGFAFAVVIFEIYNSSKQEETGGNIKKKIKSLKFTPRIQKCIMAYADTGFKRNATIRFCLRSDIKKQIFG